MLNFHSTGFLAAMRLVQIRFSRSGDWQTPARKGQIVAGKEDKGGSYPSCSLGELKLKCEGIKSLVLQTLRRVHSKLQQGKF